MCWSGPVSIALAIIGFAVAGYLARKKESKLLWIPLAYFAVMETLQAITYYNLAGCTPTNQMLTFLSYIHISFQPFFINAFSLYFIPEKFRKKIMGWVFVLCFISAVIMLTKLYPFEWAGQCIQGNSLCGERLCAIPGNFHLGWEIPFNGIESIEGFGYILSGFILPFMYGAWKITLYNVILGPALARLLTNNPHEIAAVWCFLSVAYIIVILIPKLRKFMHQKKWYFWEYPS